MIYYLTSNIPISWFPVIGVAKCFKYHAQGTFKSTRHVDLQITFGFVSELTKGEFVSVLIFIVIFLDICNRTIVFKEFLRVGFEVSLRKER